MPQPHLPAPLVRRPEPGAQLLEAVRQRQAGPTLQLTQQWVHRRGVLDLERFCSTELSSALGPEALTWLQELLALDTPLHPAPVSTSTCPGAGVETAPEAPSSASTGVSTSLPVGQAEPKSPAETGSSAAAWASDSAERPVSPPVFSETPSVEQQTDLQQLEQELHARAVAAVDEAFAALEQSFHQNDDQASSTPAPLAFPADSAAAPSTAPSQAPAPLPVRSGLWPSLRASAASIGSAFRPLSGTTQNSPLPGLPNGPDASLQEEAAISGTFRDPAVPSPEPHLHESLTLPEAATSLPGAPEHRGEPAAQAKEPTETTEAVSEARDTAPAMPTATTAQVGLLRRLRTVMRDCVEETVALLRTPEQQRNGDDGSFVVSQAQEPSQPSDEPPAFSWTLESFSPPSPPPATDTAPLPDPVPAPGSDSADPASAPSLPSLVSRLRLGLPSGKPRLEDDRPAPAPAGLSDLQAWLPDRGDLPRAS